MNSKNSIIERFIACGALLEGHFLYSSGRHGSQFLQAARVLKIPSNIRGFSDRIFSKFSNESPDFVVGPATGGILLANGVAYCFGCQSMYTEKDGKGGQILKRGFKIPVGSKVLIVEDITTTGQSVKAVRDYIESIGSVCVGISVLIDRSSGEAEKLLGEKFRPLARLNMKSWSSDDCELCKQGIPLIDPDDIVLS